MEQCKDCDGGNYCDQEHATDVSGLCAAGYYCESGVDRPNPNNAETNSTYDPSCPLIGGHTGNHSNHVAVVRNHLIGGYRIDIIFT